MTDASFLDDVLAGSSRRRDKCKTGRLLDAMPDDLAKQVRAALDHPDAAHAVISRKLKDLGYDVSAHSVRLHRDGSCGCHA